MIDRWRFDKRTLRESLQAIESLATSLEPQLRAAVLSYLSQIQDEVSAARLTKLLRAGDNAAILELVTLGGSGPAAGAVSEALQSVVWAGASLAASQVNLQLRGVWFGFDRVNPQLVSWMQGYSLNLIRQIDEASKEAVRSALATGLQRGDNPVTVARNVRQAVGLTAKQARAVENFRAELEGFHLRQSAGSWNLGGAIDRVNGRQVLKPDEDGSPRDAIDTRRLRDFRHDRTLANAMRTGKPLTPQQVDKMVEAYRRKYLRHRAETIARTEAIRATNQGVQEAWRQAIQSGKADAALVRRQWVVSRDERTCEVCGPVPKLNPARGVRMDEPFQTPAGAVMLPPLHPNCRCTAFIRLWEPAQLTEVPK